VKLTSFTAVKFPNFLTSPRAEIAGSVPSGSPFVLLLFADIAISRPKVLRPRPFPPARGAMCHQCESSRRKPGARVLHASARYAAKFRLLVDLFNHAVENLSTYGIDTDLRFLADAHAEISVSGM